MGYLCSFCCWSYTGTCIGVVIIVVGHLLQTAYFMSAANGRLCLKASSILDIKVAALPLHRIASFLLGVLLAGSREEKRLILYSIIIVAFMTSACIFTSALNLEYNWEYTEAAALEST